MTLRVMANEAASTEERFAELILQIEHGPTHSERQTRTGRWSRTRRSLAEEGLADASMPGRPPKPILRPIQALDRAAGRDAPASERAARAPGFANDTGYSEISVSYDASLKAGWCAMRPSGRPSVTPALLRDILKMQRSVRNSHASEEGAAELEYLVFSSRLPGIFNLGGDLDLFRRCISAGDRTTLLDYATLCIDVVFNNYENYDLPIVTIALVQGDSLGGGFEAALSCDVIVAERGTRFGFPEVLFNMFPGMGAVSLLSRKLGSSKAHRMIDDGRVLLAEELYEMGLVHILADVGEGEAAVRTFMQRDRRRHNASVAMHRALRRANPLEYDELRSVIDLWVDAAFRIRTNDLARMGRLLAAQDRRCGI